MRLHNDKDLTTIKVENNILSILSKGCFVKFTTEDIDNIYINNNNTKIMIFYRSSIHTLSLDLSKDDLDAFKVFAKDINKNTENETLYFSCNKFMTKFKKLAFIILIMLAGVSILNSIPGGFYICGIFIIILSFVQNSSTAVLYPKQKLLKVTLNDGTLLDTSDYTIKQANDSLLAETRINEKSYSYIIKYSNYPSLKKNVLNLLDK